MKKIILMSNFMEKYQNKFNTKYNTNVTFDGTIEVSQYEKNNYIFRIRLIVISNGKIDYENYKEFIQYHNFGIVAQTSFNIPQTPPRDSSSLSSELMAIFANPLSPHVLPNEFFIIKYSYVKPLY